MGSSRGRGPYDEDLPIVHPDRTIGDTVELVPGNAVGQRGPLKEILRTRGRDERAQLLTITVVGSGNYESSLVGASNAPRGPIVATIEWGVRGAKARVEVDVPQGGVVFSLVASYVQIGARYDGLLRVNGSQLDPAAFGGLHPGPAQRVGAMVGYGAYGAASSLTRTFRLDDIRAPAGEGGPLTPAVRVPPFARRLRVGGLGIEDNSYRVRTETFRPFADGDILFPAGSGPSAIDLPGDAAFVQVQNLGPDTFTEPVLVFEVAL